MDAGFRWPDVPASLSLSLPHVTLFTNTRRGVRGLLIPMTVIHLMYREALCEQNERERQGLENTRLFIPV